MALIQTRMCIFVCLFITMTYIFHFFEFLHRIIKLKLYFIMDT
jgi:hypothetical protein